MAVTMCVGSVDGLSFTHCPNGGEEARKEYHNFENFY